MMCFTVRLAFVVALELVWSKFACGTSLHSQLLLQPAGHATVEDAGVDEVTSPTCVSWCSAHVSVWETKCAWKECVTCAPCRSDFEGTKADLDLDAKKQYMQYLASKTSAGTFALVRVATHDEMRSHDVNWAGALKENYSTSCDSWCGAHVALWKAKCSWNHCAGCLLCPEKRSRAKSDAENKDRYQHYLLMGAKTLPLRLMKNMWPSKNQLTNALMQTEESWLVAVPSKDEHSQTAKKDDSDGKEAESVDQEEESEEEDEESKENKEGNAVASSPVPVAKATIFTSLTSWIR